ncbi:RraA family protein [Pusillimonas sp. ANT_WB101]|uniref:RraA family protein n=1 Tax=Pusillimonas sp. ANT_WB101 TaxID=2597356 RepID=UPI0011EF65F3|nr:RraA family protein [Pusillimonas sp. ANT_WB101]KAA0910445.1 RraA family protein [Pusillimonas sp. ANT_WB101]
MTIELTGRIAREKIKLLELPHTDPTILAEFEALGDATSAVSDALDSLGIPGAISASKLRCIMPNRRMVGTALTLKNVAREEDPFLLAQANDSRMAEIECHNLAKPGDVLVIQGVAGASNMGSVGGRMGKRQGEVGAIVDGAVRDVPDFIAIGYPIWSTEITPITGKWRVESVEINGMVNICGIEVHPGDLVVADGAGVCFIPRSHILEVLAFAKRKVQYEIDKCAEVDGGKRIVDLAKS